MVRAGSSAVDAVAVVSMDSGQSWRETKGVISFYNAARANLVFGADEEWIVRTAIQGVLRSTDGGTTWDSWFPG